LVNMDKYSNHRAIIFSIIFLLFATCFNPILSTQKENLNYVKCLNTDSGQILYAPMYFSTTYLIDKNGDVIHKWDSDYFPGESVYMLNDGSILYTIKLPSVYGGAGGGVQKITWDGDLVWDFRYSNSEHLSHHDIKPLPNGNILMIAWEFKTRDEAIAAGRDPDTFVGDTFMPDHVIEVKPTGPTSGDIVWEWHVWDHLIQDFDPSKDNYGVVGDHPELVDINYGMIFQLDWLHTNSIDYNLEFDQILISIPHFNEIWIIDHSTTTAEAAGHTGGNSGKGGDILYRWGNPEAYERGTTSNQKLFNQHDATWIDHDCPGGGDILIFNNGFGRPGNDYSSVDEIIPPVDENGNYFLNPGSSYGPFEQVWIYTAQNPTDWFTALYSGSVRISNGNTVICDGTSGKFFEVTPGKEIVWEYVNPYPTLLQNQVFKIQYFPSQDTQPLANFIFSPINPKQNEIVYFTDTSTDDGTIISWFWDFGDGYTSTDENPTHQYSEIGTFTVTLNVTDNDGLTDDISKNLTISNDMPPEISNYKAVPTLQLPGGYVNISAQVTDDSGLAEIYVIIHYPDNHIENISIIENKNNDTYYYNNTYNTLGLYSCWIWAVDNNGNKASSLPIYFTISDEFVCDADGPYNGLINEEIQFNGYVVNGESPYTWHWDFGDGETSNEQNPTHIYDVMGNYTVTLTVTDSEDNIASDTTWALIQNCSPPLPPTINGPTKGRPNVVYDYKFSFATDPNGDELYLYVDFGDGNTGWIGPYIPGVEVIIKYSWSEKGIYTIKAKTKNNCGESLWSSLEATIPRNKIATNFLLQRFLQNHPNLFLILQKLLNRLEQ
jgi:PKD repeat protein